MMADATNTIRVLLVDDHALVRTGLSILIAQQPSIVVVGEAENGVEALAYAVREQPDVILLDLDLNGESGLDLLPKLLQAVPQGRVIILTGSRETDAHRHAVRSGAMGLVLKSHASDVLVRAIQKVYAGEVWLDRTIMASVLADIAPNRAEQKQQSDPEQAKIATLTEREREVIALIAQGLKNKQIAQQLFISEATVNHHLTSIFGKLGVATRLELAIYAYRNGLADHR